MKPIEFEGYNVVFGEGQKEYLPLPAKRCKETGAIITCWKMSFSERVKVLLFGVVYLRVMTFGEPLQPLNMSTEKEFL